MAAILDQRRSRSARLARRVAGFAALLAIVSAASHRLALLGTPGFTAVLGVVVGLALVALLLAGVGFRSVWQNGDRGAGDVFATVVIAILVLVPFGFAGWTALRLPLLHDISTDTYDPPPFAAPRWSNLAFDETAAERQRTAYPDVVGRRYQTAGDRVLGAVERLIAERGWTAQAPAITGDGATVIEAALLSTVFGFASDVAIRIAEDGETTVVDMRSASRFGRHDFGSNAGRIAAFLMALDAEMAKQTGLSN